MKEFSNISPIDSRYYDAEMANYFSEAAFLEYKKQVELALMQTMHQYKVCSLESVQEVRQACSKLEIQEVNAEEQRIGHDVRALVNCIRFQVSDKTKPFVHLGATSNDINDNANIMRFRDAINNVVLPNLRVLLGSLISLARAGADVTQVGRTHGQRAVSITVGFFLAGYIERIGNAFVAIEKATQNLRGKFAGAVGANNALSIIVENPDDFEMDLLAKLKLYPTYHATQIVPPEPLARLLSELTILAGIMANLADDMRNLQRSEIAEISEGFDDNQVGSSTMPQKQNPISFENVKSFYKIVMPRLQTVMLDLISEHQRDLTNSASSRTYGEMVVYVNLMTKRLAAAISNVQINKTSLAKNLFSSDNIVAEPLYILLSKYGHPNAHEAIRKLTASAKKNKKSLLESAQEDKSLHKYTKQCSIKERLFILNPRRYTGVSKKKTLLIIDRWINKLQLQNHAENKVIGPSMFTT